MGYPINKPEHPVIDRDPPVSKIFAAFRAQDWSNVALLTGVSLPFGYIAGTLEAFQQAYLWTFILKTFDVSRVFSALTVVVVIVALSQIANCGRVGRPLLMRPSMYVAGTLGAMAGILLGAQSSFARLTGYKENAVEVVKYHSPATATVEPNNSS